MNIDLSVEMNSLMQHWSPGASSRGMRKKPIVDSFTRLQKDRLLQLREAVSESMAGVAKDTRTSSNEASALGTHQADAGSDAYDRDFVLSHLSREQDALHEINQALQRIDAGTYGVCEMSGKPITRARLEAIPFARLTVECQSQLEKENKVSRVRLPATSPCYPADEDDEEGDEEPSVANTQD